MSDEIRTAERRRILFGDSAPDHEFVRLEAARRVQSKNYMESARDVLAMWSHQQTSPAQEPNSFTAASRSLVDWWSWVRQSKVRAVDVLDSQSTLVLSRCVELVRRLVQEGQTRVARQYLHEVIDDLLKRGHFATVDAIICSADPMHDDPRILISLLTATKAARERLKLRRDFYERTADALKQRQVDEPGLLTGLE